MKRASLDNCIRNQNSLNEDLEVLENQGTASAALESQSKTAIIDERSPELKKKQPSQEKIANIIQDSAQYTVKETAQLIKADSRTKTNDSPDSHLRSDTRFVEIQNYQDTLKKGIQLMDKPNDHTSEGSAPEGRSVLEQSPKINQIGMKFPPNVRIVASKQN